MTEKLSKKEMKEPDWFQTEFARILAFLTHHRKQVVWGVGIAASLFLCAVGWYFYNLNYEKQAGRLYEQALQETGSADAAAGEKNTIKILTDVAAKYPRSDAAALAHYRLGNIYYKQGEMDRSLASFRELIKRAPRDSDLVTLSHSGLGYCYEAKKDFAKALAAFQDAVNSPKGWAFAVTLFGNVGRVYEEMNQPAKAVEFYRKALEKTSDQGLKLILTRKIAMIGDLPHGQ
jgi:tetratricopeptide (TPR) repeat protein